LSPGGPSALILSKREKEVRTRWGGVLNKLIPAFPNIRVLYEYYPSHEDFRGSHAPPARDLRSGHLVAARSGRGRSVTIAVVAIPSLSLITNRYIALQQRLVNSCRNLPRAVAINARLKSLKSPLPGPWRRDGTFPSCYAPWRRSV
jgi:hypothetical protein